MLWLFLAFLFKKCTIFVTLVQIVITLDKTVVVSQHHS